MFAVINNRTLEAIPVSNSERGAKNYATRNGYHMVSRISQINNMVVETYIKIGNRWEKE